MSQVILFRKSFDTEEEIDIARNYFDCKFIRSQCKNSLVIPRYCALPYYNELVQDLEYNGCKPINSTTQFNWIKNADYMQNLELQPYQPRSWFDWQINDIPDIQLVVKGRTNSRKHKWATHMYAKNKADAIRIMIELLDDDLIKDQGVVFREYIPLVKFGEDSISKVPHSNEWRFFFYKRHMLATGYYWASAEPNITENVNISSECLRFAQSCANIVSQHTDFYVLDVAETQNGKWILIEINSGEMSGLSCIDPNILYKNLFFALKGINNGF